MALTTLHLRHQLRRALSHLTTTTIKHLIPYSSLQRLTTTSTSTATATATLSFTYRNLHLTHFPRSFLPSSRPFNAINKIDPDSILYEECDYKHWLIVMDFGSDRSQFPPPVQMIETYVHTAALVVGCVEEAKRKIYACSTTDYTGFQVEVDEETSKKFEGLPGVIFVLPDYSYMGPVNNEYEGDEYINGETIHRPAPVQYGRARRPDGLNETRERFPMSNQRRNPGFNQQGNPPYNQQVNPPYNQQRDPAYYQQQVSPSPYDCQENPAYNQQESTRKYGRSYMPQGFYQLQYLPPQQNYPPNQNMGSFNPTPNSNSIPYSMPPYNQQANPLYNQPGNTPYNCQGNPAYNQQEPTRGYGRFYAPQSPQQWQPLPPQQNYRPNQNMGSFNPAAISYFIPYSMPPYNQLGNPAYNQQFDSPYYQQGNPAYNQQKNSPYNQQKNSPYNQHGNPTYNQQHDSPYNQQGSPAYDEQESTRGYGRSDTPQSSQQQQPLPPQQNDPPNQNMGSFNPLPTSNSIPPYNRYNRQGNPAYYPQQYSPYNQQKNPAYNQQKSTRGYGRSYTPRNRQGRQHLPPKQNDPPNRQGNLAYNLQQDSPYNQQKNPAYNQQKSTRGYGRSYTPRSRQGRQSLPPKHNDPPNQNMRSSKPAPNIDSILKSLPPSKRGNYYFAYN